MTWNVRSLYKSVSLTTGARELARYRLDLVGVQEFRWGKGGMVGVSSARSWVSGVCNKLLRREPTLQRFKRLEFASFEASAAK